MIDLRPHNDPKRLMEEAKGWAATCQRQKEELERLRAALKATQGRIMNVQFGLQTNTTKASAANDLSMIASKIAAALQGDAP